MVTTFRMNATANDEIAEWRSRLAHALRAAFHAADRLASRAEMATLEERVRALESEGQSKGFMPAPPAVSRADGLRQSATRPS